MDIQARLERLAMRRTDPSLFEARTGSYESYRDLKVPDPIRYIIGAMQPIDTQYTERTLEQGRRVRDQLSKRLEDGVEFRFQGSVVNDTHIRQHSDIDLLVFTGRFIFLKPPLVARNRYTEDTTKDMTELRDSARTALAEAFPAVDVDDSGDRSIELSGGSLARNVDVVPAAWYDTQEFDETGDEVHRGVKVFSRAKSSFAANYPFKNAAEIDAKDRRCSGGMRKAARFLKTLKADNENIRLSSYDLASIAWNMPDASLNYGMPWDLKIFYGCRDFLRKIVNEASFRGGLSVPDGTRRIFSDGHATVDAARVLLSDIDALASQFSRAVEAKVLHEHKTDVPQVRYPNLYHSTVHF